MGFEVESGPKFWKKNQEASWNGSVFEEKPEEERMILDKTKLFRTKKYNKDVKSVKLIRSELHKCSEETDAMSKSNSSAQEKKGIVTLVTISLICGILSIWTCPTVLVGILFSVIGFVLLSAAVISAAIWKVVLPKGLITWSRRICFMGLCLSFLVGLIQWMSLGF